MNRNYVESFFFGNELAGAVVRTEPLRPIKDAFLANQTRVLALASLPLHLALVATEYGSASAQAEYKVIGKFNAPEHELAPHSQRIAATKLDLMRATAQLPNRIETKQAEMEKMLDVFFDFLRPTGDIGVSAVFNSMVVQAWTAFEVLAGDLWEASLNFHPWGLAELTGNPTLWAIRPPRSPLFNEPQQDQKTEQIGKQVRIEFLQKYGYNLQGRMGTVLREKLRLAYLPKIRSAYARAFKVDFDVIKAAIMDSCFDTLSAVRNVIVHKSGEADSEFIAATSTDAMFAGLQEGKSLVLNGTMVQSIIKSSFAKSLELILAVDQWMVDHESARASGEEQ